MPVAYRDDAPSRILEPATLLFLLATGIFLYALLFLPPLIPIDSHGDGSVWLSEAKRMAEGDAIYRDFFDFVTPGTPLIYALAFKGVGLRLWIPGLSLIVLGLGFTIMTLIIGRHLMGRGATLLVAAIFIAGIYKNQMDTTHHWFSLIAAMGALAVAIKKHSPFTMASAGALSGLSASFTQTRGVAVLLGFGAFLWWESRSCGETAGATSRKFAALAAGFSAAFVAVNAYFIWNAGLSRFVWSTVVFTLKYGPRMADVNTLRVLQRDFPTFLEVRAAPVEAIGALFIYLAVPLIYLAVLIHCRRHSKEADLESRKSPMLVAIVGISLLLSVAPAPDVLRMSASALPAVILLGWLIEQSGKPKRAILAVLTIAVLAVVPHAVAKAQSVKAAILETSRGPLAETTRDKISYEEYEWVQRHVHPGDYFYKPADADIYFALDLRNPTSMSFVVNNAFTTGDQVTAVVQGLVNHPTRYILWSRGEEDGLDTIPDWENPADDHLGLLREYLHRHYRLAKVFSNSDEIWKKTD